MYAGKIKHMFCICLLTKNMMTEDAAVIYHCYNIYNIFCVVFLLSKTFM